VNAAAPGGMNSHYPEYKQHSWYLYLVGQTTATAKSLTHTQVLQHDSLVNETEASNTHQLEASHEKTLLK